MLFGLASNDLEQVRQSRGWGYDYVEIFASLLLPLEPDGRWPARRRELQDTGADLSALCQFIPGEARYVGPIVDWGRTRAYLETCVGRGAEVGVKVFNWGSPLSKSVPEGWPYSKAFEQIERAAHLIADVVKAHNAICVIEPINPRECNIVYYLTDAMLLARSVGRERMRVIADYFHMALQNEPAEHIGRVAAWLAHAHTSGPERHFPKPTDPWDHAGFLRQLRAVGYDRTLGFECSRVPPGADYAAEARDGVAYMRRLWSEA
jgi:sugar phosphate isomerase/epimerase